MKTETSQTQTRIQLWQMQQPLNVSLKKPGLSLPGLENTAKRCVVTVDHVGKYAFDNKKCFCYGSSASPASGAVIIKWCTSWLAAWLTLLCCRFSAFSHAHPSLFSCQLRRFTASCKLVCRGSVVHPSVMAIAALSWSWQEAGILITL